MSSIALQKWLFTLIMLLAFPAVAAETCRDHDIAIVAAARAGDVERAEQIISTAATTGICSGADLSTLGRKAAAVAYARAAKTDTPDSGRGQMLERALKLGRIWQVLATLGDRAKAAKLRAIFRKRWTISAMSWPTRRHHHVS
jgi:hypothetical protein